MNSSIRSAENAYSDFEVLWEDGDLVFCSTWRSDIDGSRRRVLAVMPTAELPTRATLDRLQHEYELKDELDGSWAARPLALESEDGRPMLVLEDAAGEPLEGLLDAPMEIETFLRIALGSVAALGQAHQRGLIHKDVKPANILVNRASGQVQLTGFGIATRMRRERQAPEPLEVIAGTLAFMAPEQTGRMNRSVDARSDLYALGVTFYKMLAGVLPFLATDPMDWVHCHIARMPVPPADRVPTIPSILSAIVMKLLAKTAEERYQTAAGVERDLERCLADWEAHGHIDDFLLGQSDAPDRLVIPEKLYGRQREVEILLAGFDRVKSGPPELVLVTGYSGIGKSAVVNELHKVLVAPRALFASGKFDQYQRDVPYATLAQAFRSLVRTLLAKNDTELNTWRDALVEALGPNGRLMTDLVPELKLIIGEQSPVPELPPRDAQRRFQLVFLRFISVFARPEHPLALFLDDLQWLDAATLDVLEALLASSDLNHLMLIGAYRDNEVDLRHPLRRKLEAIKDCGGKIVEIRLEPLAEEHLGMLISEALRCTPAKAATLAQLVHEKTGGNPFFAIQFISSLAEEGLLTFDHSTARWCWELEHIHTKDYSDNVVDLMVGRVARLPTQTQTALQQLACLGNVADVRQISMVLGISEEHVNAVLWPAVREELIERRRTGAYQFIHDRIQEATYSLIPENSRAAAHLRVGRMLVAQRADQREDNIFDIVNQLNRSAALITSLQEREQLAEFNLIAGKRAKASAAYTSALNYFTAGSALLAEDCWERRHELAFALELNRAECEFLTGTVEAAEQRLLVLSARATNLVDQAAVVCSQADLYVTLDQSDRAVAVGLEYLRHLGIDWSPHPIEAEVEREYARIWSQLGSRRIEELTELPLMNDSASLAALNVLARICPAAMFTDASLYFLVICRGVSLSIERGHADGSCLAYSALGMIAGPRFGDYQAGFRFGQLAYQLVEQRGLKRLQAGTYLLFGGHVMPWTKHLRAGRDLVRQAFEVANEAGDLTYAAYSRQQLSNNLLAAGARLVEVQREADDGLNFARKLKFGYVSDLITTQLALIRTLQGLTLKFGCFDDEQFDERQFEAHLSSNPALVVGECWYWIRKLQARFLAGDYASAIYAASRVQGLPSALAASVSQLETAEWHFYGALVRAIACDNAAGAERQQHLEALATHHRQLAEWAESCPVNFENRAALVSAEIARIEGRDLDAQRLYEQAIRSARENAFVQNEAVAYEIAARFYDARGFEHFARLYLRHARDCYLRWGADGKVRQLDDLYPHLKTEEPKYSPTSTIAEPVGQLDLATVIKVSQAVSSEVVFEKLLQTLMHNALEHAGAQRGIMILSSGVELRIAAEATTHEETIIVHLSDRLVSQEDLPDAVLQYALHTREDVILDDAAGSSPFAGDPYIQQRQARSILCLSLVTQAKLIGVLYLENNMAPRVFAPARIAVSKMLASQAAIALKNTRAEEIMRRLQMELAHSNRVATMGQLTGSISHEVNQPIAAMTTNAQAALRWLGGQRPDLDEARQALARIVRDGQRAAEVVGRIRALIQKVPATKHALEINQTLLEVIHLLHNEAVKHGVAVQTALANDLPLIEGDRVQLQQVVLNLMMNAFEAMSGTGDAKRELHISTRKAEPEGVLVAVRDTGPGLAPETLKNLVHPFYTTKPGGLGLGLPICRSIIEAHGGRMWATANVPQGVVFEFTVPIHPKVAS